jgi:hypothetical protein
MRTGTANLPLHGGAAPSWLFQRMKLLSREIVLLMVSEFGAEDVLERLSDPYWFQAFGCVLGFDWHSSGVTTTVCGALKEGLRGLEKDTGIYVAGGKGKTSLQTPADIVKHAEKHSLNLDASKLVYASKISAKVDNTAVQDGYQLYHHSFFFTKDGVWTVVQQGMNTDNRWARRYHWLSKKLTDFVVEPHAAVCSDQRVQLVLNMVAEEAGESRQVTAALANEKPEKIITEIKKLQSLTLPKRHHLMVQDLRPDSLAKILPKAYDKQPENFLQLLETEGVGPKTIRALALVADLVYGAKTSLRDPARYSFAHGGKDGTPYPVDKEVYDSTIETLRKMLSQSKIGNYDKQRAFQRLGKFCGELTSEKP